MKHIRTFVIVPALAGVLAAGGVFAQGPAQGPDGPRRGVGPRGGAMMELRGLNLTEAQREQIRTLMQQHREQSRGAAERLRTALDAQRRAAEATPFNEQAVRATTQELAQAQTEMAVLQARLRSDIFNLLTADQQAQVAKRRAERDQRRAQQRERMQQRMQQRPQG